MVYAVLADTRQVALAAVEAVVQPADYVEMRDGELSPETVRALGLQPGQAKPSHFVREGPLWALTGRHGHGSANGAARVRGR
jgi:hypothetical protein